MAETNDSVSGSRSQKTQGLVAEIEDAGSGNRFQRTQYMVLGREPRVS